MGKISPVSSKYIVHTQIDAEGIVERPDVIGAIFGQTEGLLGNELELRELQRSGRVGRIEVNLATKAGKTNGTIIIPSSLDKAETAIVGAALETIEKIGPCNAKLRIVKIEDVRVSKRNYVIERAKELLQNLTNTVLPDSQEITEEVAHSVRMMDITEYGKDKLPAGPNIEDSEEIIIVEGRADVLNLLKQGFKNAIGMNGTNIPQTIIDLSKKKTITAFVDGDRGGDLIIKELSEVAEPDFVVKAPDGKEVEELTKKEIHNAIRGKIAIEQFKLDMTKISSNRRNSGVSRSYERPKTSYSRSTNVDTKSFSKPRAPKEDLTKFKKLLDDLVGTRGAYILDKDSNVLGKVPISELITTIGGLKNVYALILDGSIDKDLAYASERSRIKYLIATKSDIKSTETRVNILTSSDF